MIIIDFKNFPQEFDKFPVMEDLTAEQQEYININGTRGFADRFPSTISIVDGKKISKVFFSAFHINWIADTIKSLHKAFKRIWSNQGTYSSNSIYCKGDLVEYNNQSYLCLQDCSNIAISNKNYWRLVSGRDGVSPTISIIKKNSTATIEIEDVNGTTTTTLTDGKNGKDGQNGEDGVLYYLKSSDPFIKIDENGLFNPASINITAYKKVGSQNAEPTSCYIYLYSINPNEDWQLINSVSGGNNISYPLGDQNKNAVSYKVTMAVGGSTIDEIILPVINTKSIADNLNTSISKNITTKTINVQNLYVEGNPTANNEHIYTIKSSDYIGEAGVANRIDFIKTLGGDSVVKIEKDGDVSKISIDGDIFIDGKKQIQIGSNNNPFILNQHTMRQHGEFDIIATKKLNISTDNFKLYGGSSDGKARITSNADQFKLRYSANSNIDFNDNGIKINGNLQLNDVSTNAGITIEDGYTQDEIDCLDNNSIQNLFIAIKRTIENKENAWSINNSNGTAYFNNTMTYTAIVPNVINETEVKIINHTSFENAICLGKIEIPDELPVRVTIQNNIKGLKEILVGNKVAFLMCQNNTALENLIIHDGITEIPDWAFTGCPSLRSINIPSTVISIGKGAFNHCNNLSTIEIPSSVTSIGDLAFNDCNKLTTIVINRPVDTIACAPWNATNAEIIWTGTHSWTLKNNETTSDFNVDNGISHNGVTNENAQYILSSVESLNLKKDDKIKIAINSPSLDNMQYVTVYIMGENVGTIETTSDTEFIYTVNADTTSKIEISFDGSEADLSFAFDVSIYLNNNKIL